jgi:hypothetical protein
MGSESTHGVVMEVQESKATLHAYLADFTINDAGLKSTHVDFLKKVFAAIAANPSATGFEGWIITLWGKTSRTGNQNLNRNLAARRTAAVRTYLEQLLRSLPNHRVRFVEFPWEEEMAGTDNDVESEFHRSVEVWLTKAPVPKPKEKRLPTVVRPFSDRFAIRQLADFEISSTLSPQNSAKIKGRMDRGRLEKLANKVGIVTIYQVYEIRDLKNQTSAFYFYDAAGIGRGVGPPASVTGRGPPNKFTTSKPIHVSKFAGWARYATAGGGGHTLNYLHMLGTPEGVDSVYLKLNTGTTLGLGAAEVIGQLELIEIKPTILVDAKGYQ